MNFKERVLELICLEEKEDKRMLDLREKTYETLKKFPNIKIVNDRDFFQHAEAVAIQPSSVNKFLETLKLLGSGGNLWGNPAYRSHKLDVNGWTDSHISGKFVLIYTIKDRIVYLRLLGHDKDVIRAANRLEKV